MKMSKFTIEELEGFKTLTDSVKAKDAIGEGKCAPTGIDFVREAGRIEAELNKHSNDPKAKAYLEQRISQMKKLIAKHRIEVTDFDYYWSNHKKELNKNYDEANRLLIALENKL